MADAVKDCPRCRELEAALREAKRLLCETHQFEAAAKLSRLLQDNEAIGTGR